jgi:hypothetical protein
LKWDIVILNEVKNLIESMSYETEILRLKPQNDTATQFLDWAIQKKTGFGACPVLDTGVDPPKAEDNDKPWNRVRHR